MKISKVIVKKLNGITLSETEKVFFDKWILDSENNRELFAYFEAHKNNGGDISKLDDWDAEAAWFKLTERNREEQTTPFHKSNWKSILRYAAVFVGILFLGYGYFAFDFNPKDKIVDHSDTITLEMDNGKVLVVDEKNKFDITGNSGEVVGSKDEDQISYKGAEAADKLVFNKLTVPYGKTFKLVLSDGTKVHLNSGTSLRYPVKFIKGQIRHVSLVGEAYFEVAKDKAHPFVVSVSEMDVRVYGTRFNVSAYPEDQFVSTVLVEGSVGLTESGFRDDAHKENDVVKLVPGQKADWNLNVLDGKVSITKVDTNIYTDWMKGRIVLKKVSFANVLKKLERHFNVEIENRYTAINDDVFTVSFDVENIEEILASFAENKGFHFTVNDKKITIEKPN